MPAVLGIDVDRVLFARWAEWVAPDPQPFLVASPADWPDCDDEGGVLVEELKDTYRLWWGVDRNSSLLWISEAQFTQLSKETRGALVREQVRRRRGAVPTVRAWRDLLDGGQLRRQADGHRFVWWPSLMATNPEAILVRIVSDRRLPSLHLEVDDDVWRAADTILPEARRLGGTFPDGSTTNCFGAVLEAAGAASAAVYADTAPFEAWLESACRRGGDVGRPGVVLVWRGRQDAPVHAAVSLGGGWALEKPSKDWHSPIAVIPVAEVMRMSRHPGERVERHTIQ